MSLYMETLNARVSKYHDLNTTLNYTSNKKLIELIEKTTIKETKVFKTEISKKIKHITHLF